MNLREWSQSEVEYGRKVLHSGLAGARSGREAFLNGRPLTPFVNEAVRNASVPAAVGALLGVLVSQPRDRQAACKAIGFAILGGTIGLGLGMAWQSRGLTASVTGAALGSIGKVRDEHWLERHPIDYA
jgi:hypothetical protein